MNESKNLYWINAIKGICMIAVFYVHCMLLCGPRIEFASAEIHAFYVNGFFFISGYLLFWKQLTPPRINESLRMYVGQTGGGKILFDNICFRIIIPSIIFATLFYFPAKFVKHEEMTVIDFLLEPIGGRTFWFTSALVVAEVVVLFLLLTRIRSIWFYVFCFIPIVVLGFFYAVQSPETYALDIWAWRRGVLSLIFLGFGGLYWKFEAWIDKYVLNWWSVALLFIVMELLIWYIGDEDSMLVSMLTITPLGIIPALISVLLLIKFCKILPYSKILSFIGQNSIGFFFLCSGVPLLLSVVLHRYIEGEPIWGLFVSVIISLVFSYGVVLVLNRWFPWVFDIRRIKKHKS